MMKTRAYLWTIAALAWAAPLAAGDDGFEVPKLEGKVDWIAIVVAVVALVATAAAAFKNAKRTHLD